MKTEAPSVHRGPGERLERDGFEIVAGVLAVIMLVLYILRKKSKKK